MINPYGIKHGDTRKPTYRKKWWPRTSKKFPQWSLMFEEKWNPITWRSNLGRRYMMDTTFFLLNSQTINLWWNTFQTWVINVSWSYLTTAFSNVLRINPLDIFNQMFLFKIFIFWDGLFPHACFFSGRDSNKSIHSQMCPRSIGKPLRFRVRAPSTRKAKKLKA